MHFNTDFVGEYAREFERILAREAYYRSQRGLPPEPGYEWEGYDGWFNNPAHPDWGGAGMYLGTDPIFNVGSTMLLLCSASYITLSVLVRRYALRKEDTCSLP